MKKFIVYPTLYATGTPIEVRAETKEKAIEIAEKTYDVPTLCWSCSDEVELSDAVEFNIKNVEEVEND